MTRCFKTLALALSLALASPVYAQMSFEGLDLSGSKKKKKRPTKKSTKSAPSEKAEEKDEED